jgi:hypothetical protein
MIRISLSFRGLTMAALIQPPSWRKAPQNAVIFRLLG